MHKMSHLIGFILAIASIVTTCTSLPELHKLMSPQQLQSVFHVDSVDAVPHYEVVQLLHHSASDGVANAALLPAPHYRRRRAINTINAGAASKLSHHVKKDLSKNPYYSELKAAAASAGGANSVNVQAPVASKHAVDLRELKAHNVSFSAFGQHMNLTLRPTQGLFNGAPHQLRMWTVNNEPNATHGLDLQEVLDKDAQSSEQIGEVFQDEANMAAILMRRHMETGDLIMEGSIGHEMVIKPLPHELSPNKDAAHHVIFKREAAPFDHLSDFAYMEPDDLAASEKLEKLQRRRRRATTLADFDAAAEDEVPLEQDDDVETAAGEATRTRTKRQTPYTIYPEVLVIVDYDGYRLHGGDNLQVKRYFISFWNGVDLRYRLLKGPKIRISIAGIIISRGRDATPYLERNRVGRDAIDSAAALTDMGKYLFRERRLPVYDIAVAITKLDMCRRTSAYDECNRGTAGFAYVGGACVVNKRLEKVNSVAIIEDTGGFSGIIVAAHEVGHLLGAVHDGSPPPSYLGGPGAQRCRWEDGYIMSDLRHTERGFRWSPCTVQSFHHFLNGDTATCLHNAPHEDGALGRSLPGTLLSLDAQCRRDRGTYACFKDERVCAQLFCFDSQTGYCVAYRPAAEGSSCGNGLQCLDGRCTPLPQNVIPGYRVVYNNANDATSNGENSSEEEDDDDNSDEENNSNSEEEQENVVESSKRVDNSVEESSIEVTDEHKNINNNNNKHTNTTTSSNNHTNPTATAKATTKTTQQNKTNANTKTTTTQNTQQRQPPALIRHGTFEFLARILEHNLQWQQLLGRATTAAVVATANTAAPTAATTEAAQTAAATTAEKEEEEEENADMKLMQQQHIGAVIVKMSTSSSVSSSSSSSSSSRGRSSSSSSSSDSNNSSSGSSSRSSATGSREGSERQTAAKHENHSKEITAQQQPQHTHQHQPQGSTQQQQQIQPNLFQLYTSEVRKQFDYYLGLLGQTANSSNSQSANGSSSSKTSPTHKRELPATKNSNYSSTNNNSNHGNNGNTGTHHTTNSNNAAADGNSSTDDVDDNDDVDDVNDESNEAIDKQKLVNWKAFPF